MLFFLSISCFSCISAPHIAESLWFILRLPKKSILTVFASFIIVFIEGQNSGVPFYAAIQHQALNKNSLHLPGEDLVIGQVK